MRDVVSLHGTPLEERALAALTSGALTPVLQRYALERAADAHPAIESRATTGKVVLVPG